MTDPAFAAAAPLRALIIRTETGTAGPEAYLTIIGHRQDDLDRPLVEMTVDQVLAAQLVWVRQWGLPSGAAGAYQIIDDTLLGLKRSMKLTGAERFTPDLQDRMGQKLLEQRGLLKFFKGALTRQQFGNALAKEWASFPVFTRMKGQHRQLEIGQSYYDGDGINDCLVDVATVAAAMEEAREIWTKLGGKGGNHIADAGKKVPPPPPDWDVTIGHPPRVPPRRPEATKQGDPLVELIQQALLAKGYAMVGRVDGRAGRNTRAAIRAFEDENGLPDSGEPTAELLAQILAAPARPVSEQREAASPAAVREAVPEVKANWLSGLVALGMAGLSGIGAAVGFAVENFVVVKAAAQPILDQLGDVPAWAYAAVFGGVALWLWWHARKGEAAGVEAFKRGERR